jgi:hypothetical protein
MIEVKVKRIRINRQGYAPNGEYFGVGQGPLFHVDWYYPNGYHSRTTESGLSYQALRRHLKAHSSRCKVLP